MGASSIGFVARLSQVGELGRRTRLIDGRTKKAVENIPGAKERTMSKQNWKQVVSAAARILLACALVSVQGASAQDSTAQGRPKPVATQTSEKQAPPAAKANARVEEPQKETAQAIAAEKQSGNGSHEGIKVHGHWTIEVRNPDGTVVTHREFENALVPGTVLASILSRQSSVGPWLITLSGGVCNVNGPVDCYVQEAAAQLFAGPNAFNTLSIGTSGSNGGNFTLSGTAVAGLSGSIGMVRTSIMACTPPQLPNGSPCQTGSLFALTQTSPSPIQVSAGQTVAVTVTISFS
jgi:hypothetical protein